MTMEAQILLSSSCSSPISSPRPRRPSNARSFTYGGTDAEPLLAYRPRHSSEGDLRSVSAWYRDKVWGWTAADLPRSSSPSVLLFADDLPPSPPPQDSPTGKPLAPSPLSPTLRRESSSIVASDRGSDTWQGRWVPKGSNSHVSKAKLRDYWAMRQEIITEKDRKQKQNRACELCGCYPAKVDISEGKEQRLLLSDEEDFQTKYNYDGDDEDFQTVNKYDGDEEGIIMEGEIDRRRTEIVRQIYQNPRKQGHMFENARFDNSCDSRDGKRGKQDEQSIHLVLIAHY